MVVSVGKTKTKLDSAVSFFPDYFRTTFKILIVFAALLAPAWRSLPPFCLSKDFHQDYVSAMALRSGIDIFQPGTNLTKQFFGPGIPGFSHPNPHPPLLVSLVVPLTFIPYQVLTPIWFMLNIVFLIWIGRQLRLTVLNSLLLSAWPPIWLVLYEGQWELLLLVILLFAWRIESRSHKLIGGACIGALGALKIYPLFLLLPYIFRKRFQLVFSAGMTLVFLQILTISIIGFENFKKYYLEVIPSVGKHYAYFMLNSSPHAALQRVFGNTPDFAHIVSLPWIVLPATAAIFLFAIISLRYVSIKASPVAMMCALPNVWSMYSVFILPQIVEMFRLGKKRILLFLAVAAASCAFPIVQFVTNSYSPQHARMVTLLLALQPIGYMILLCLSFPKSKIYQKSVVD